MKVRQEVQEYPNKSLGQASMEKLTEWRQMVELNLL